MSKREVEIVVISDVHLGTYGCQSKELTRYLKSIKPKKLILNGKRVWIFHGDVFDATMKQAKWLARLGGIGYDMLIMLNSLVNFVLIKMGREKMSLSKRIKNSVKSAVKYVQDFEQVASDLAVENKFDYLICGHIHQPQIKIMKDSQKRGEVLYLNSGDWIENLTSLEYHEGEWKLYQYYAQEMENNQATRGTKQKENFEVEK